MALRLGCGYAQKSAKLTEKAFLSRLAVTVITIVLCLAGMFVTAYAYFSVEVSSRNNTITAAYCDVGVCVLPVAQGYAEGDAEPDADLYEVSGRVFVMPEGVTSVTFALVNEGTASSGYCEMIVGGESYFVELPREITVNAVSGTRIEFVPYWGECKGEFFAGEAIGEPIEVDLALMPEDVPGGLLPGETLACSEMPDVAVLNAAAAENAPEGGEFCGWRVQGGLGNEIVAAEALEDFLLELFAAAEEYGDELTLSLTPMYRAATEIEEEIDEKLDEIEEIEPPAVEGGKTPGEDEPAAGGETPGVDAPAEGGGETPGEDEPADEGGENSGGDEPVNEGGETPGGNEPAAGGEITGEGEPAVEGEENPGVDEPADEGEENSGEDEPAVEGEEIPGGNEPAVEGGENSDGDEPAEGGESSDDSGSDESAGESEDAVSDEGSDDSSADDGGSDESVGGSEDAVSDEGSGESSDDSSADGGESAE